MTADMPDWWSLMLTDLDAREEALDRALPVSLGVAAGELGVSREAVVKMVDEGEIQTVQWRGHTRITRRVLQDVRWHRQMDAVEKYLADNSDSDLPYGELLLQAFDQGPTPIPAPIPESVIYFIRFGDRVKIGYTTKLERRLKQLPHDEVLAVVPGSRDDERALHARFAAFRVTGEWFTYTEPLRSHVLQIQADSTDPPDLSRPAWVPVQQELPL